MAERKKHFTNNLVRALKHDVTAGSDATEYSDEVTPGLRLSVTATGRKFFYFRYNLRKKKRAMKLGEFPAMLVDAARKDAWAARARVDAGEDPQEVKRAQKSVPTFVEFVRDDYVPWARKAKKSWEDDVSRLKHHLLPIFDERRLGDITVRDVEQMVAALLAKDLEPGTCNRVLHLLSAILGKAMDYGVIQVNPCRAVKPLKENNARQRYLSPQELPRLIAASRAESNKSAGLLFEFLLLTGARREEGLQAKWCDINLSRCEWFIPQTKNGSSRHVPLNPAAVALLKRVPRVGGNPYVFVGKLPGRPLKNPTKAFRRVLKSAGITNFRIHDLRHSFASMAVNSGVSLYAVQHLLGHRNPKTTERYAHLSSAALQVASGLVAQVVQDASGKVPAGSSSASSAPSVTP
jgi:integrase